MFLFGKKIILILNKFDVFAEHCELFYGTLSAVWVIEYRVWKTLLYCYARRENNAVQWKVLPS